MTWFRRRDPKEVARLVREKTEKWEREHRAEAAALNQEARELAAAELEGTAGAGAGGGGTGVESMVAAEAGAEVQDLISLPNLPPWDQAAGASAYLLSGLPCSLPPALPPAFAPDDLIDLLITGGQMAEWFLEERPERSGLAGELGSPEQRAIEPGAPGWCTMCGRRAPSGDGVGMRNWRRHQPWCIVAGWLRARERVRQAGRQAGGVEAEWG